MGIGDLRGLHDVTNCSICEEQSLDLEEHLVIEVVAGELQRDHQNGRKKNKSSKEVDASVRYLRGFSEETDELLNHFGQGVVLLLGQTGHTTRRQVLKGVLLFQLFFL